MEKVGHSVPPKVGETTKQKVTKIVSGHLFKQIESWLFDKFLYGAVALWANQVYGPVVGALMTFVIMAPTSAIECRILLWFYDHYKVDWFGFEELKATGELTIDPPINWWRVDTHVFRFVMGILIWFTKRHPFWKIITMSIITDPLMTTIYLRHSAYSGLSARDWRNFLVSVVVGNGWWSMRMSILVSLAVMVYETWLKSFFVS
jgi:hypothetical protein